MSRANFIEIELPICHNESGRLGTEVAEVEPVGPNQFKLLYSPGVVKGMASLDFGPQGTQPFFFQFRTLPVASRLVPRGRLPLGTEPRILDAVSR